MKKNEVVLGEEKDLYGDTLYAEDVNFCIDLVNFKKDQPIEIQAKIRYNGGAEEAYLYLQEKDRVKVVFKKSLKSITPGQSVVFYLNDIVLGGGKITIE